MHLRFGLHLGGPCAQLLCDPAHTRVAPDSRGFRVLAEGDADTRARSGCRKVRLERDCSRSQAPSRPTTAARRSSACIWRQNLLIADNQSETYSHGDAQLRLALSRYASGAAAEPVGRDQNVGTRSSRP